MRILFTGASSFTGMWFARELAQAGHEVFTPLLRSKYSGLRKKRVEIVSKYCTPILNCPFGSDSFLKLIRENTFDLLCHHAADVTNYKSDDFDVVKALENNTKNLTEVLTQLKKQGCHKIVLTGSVFEPGEGEGSDHLRAVSPYGLSKGLTSEYFRYYADRFGFSLGKFVIPNPFGPYEEPRFTNFLIHSWSKNEIPEVQSPEYVRDNIHVSLLAKAYVQFAENLKGNAGFQKTNPSGYVESQGEFSKRFAKEMRSRLNLECSLNLLKQKTFPEPEKRVNFEPVSLSWSEKQAWDELADYYKET